MGAMQRATRLQPDFAGAWLNLGLAQWSAGRAEEAVDSCQRAAVADPTTDDAYVNLGYFLTIMQDERALVMYQKAEHIDPNSGENLLALGAAYMRAGNFKESVRTFDR